MFKFLQLTPRPPHIASQVAHKTSHKNLVGFRHVDHDKYEGLVASRSLRHVRFCDVKRVETGKPTSKPSYSYTIYLTAYSEFM